MTKDIMKAEHEGELKIDTVTIPCYVLLDGDKPIRVLSWSGVNKAFGSSVGGARSENSGVRNLPRILEAKGVKPFISKELSACAETPYEFRPPRGGRTAYGYEATLLPMMCEAILDAEKAGAFERNPDAPRIANILLRGLARVGIIALVDEATGFQKLRKKGALADILKKWVEQEKYRQWTRTFPLEFYERMFKLKGWSTLDPKLERPSVVGRYTNDIVYQRLAPGLLEELQKQNPVTEKGHRKQKHHQWLTGDVGHPRLKEHLIGVMAIMRSASSWDGFYRLLQRSFPKKNDQLTLLIDD